MPTCIVGMHRSGTSMVASLLSACGLYLGEPGDMLDAGPHNTLGHWENVKFLDLNERVLRALGGAWDYPPAPDAWCDTSLGDLTLRATVLLQEFSSYADWGWKDPRTSLTLPFWLDLLPDLQVVVSLRNPLEVARSLRARNRISPVLSYHLWMSYYSSILRHAPPERRVVTHYASYLRDPVGETTALLQFLHLPSPDSTVEHACRRAVPASRHQWSTRADMLDDGVPDCVVELYDLLCEEAMWKDEASPSTHIAAVPVPHHRDAPISRVENAATEDEAAAEPAGEETLRRDLAAARADTALYRHRCRQLQAQLQERITWTRALLAERQPNGNGHVPLRVPRVRQTRPAGDLPRVLVVGTYVANARNHVHHVVTEMSGARQYHVTQRWAALFGPPPTQRVADVTVASFSDRVGKWAIVDHLLEGQDLAQFDYLIVTDDDIVLPHGFLDDFLFLQEHLGFGAASPAKTPNSYNSHPMAEQQSGFLARRTRWVESGPMVSFHRSIYDLILPIDLDAPMGWGFELVWARRLLDADVPMGIIDAAPVDHSSRKIAELYDTREVLQEKLALLARHPHLPAAESFTVVEAISFDRIPGWSPAGAVEAAPARANFPLRDDWIDG